MKTPAKARARARKWQLENPEAVKEHDRRKYLRHFARMDAASRKWVEANPELARSIKRKSGLKRKYGLTQADWNNMFVSQRGACAVCQAVCRLCVDHDHKTGKVRALLCHGCNTALGFLKESVATIRALADYLDQHLKKN